MLNINIGHNVCIPMSLFHQKTEGRFSTEASVFNGFHRPSLQHYTEQKHHNMLNDYGDFMFAGWCIQHKLLFILISTPMTSKTDICRSLLLTEMNKYSKVNQNEQTHDITTDSLAKIVYVNYINHLNSV